MADAIDMLGTEPQPTVVSVYHAVKVAPPLPRGENTDDLYIKDGKVIVLGVDSEGNETATSGSGAKGTEFSFVETHDSTTPPSVLAQTTLQPLAQAAVRGVNGLLLVLGQTGSGKTQLMHGTETSEGERTWRGIVEQLLESLYAALPSDSLTAAEDIFSVRVQFLSIVNERVQDLLQPNCHAHDLQLVERVGSDVEVVGADEMEISSFQQGSRLYERVRDELSRLERYHNVDPATQTTLVRLTLRRRGTLAGGAAAAGGLAAPTLTGATVSSITVVELPGTERLAQQRERLHVSEDSFMHRSITQFAQMVDSLAGRAGPEHVPWKGGKLTTLLGDRLGVNAIVRCVATVRAGAPKVSAATLRCAEQLGKVASYPLVNSAAARGLRSIGQSEILALRSDLRALATKGVVRGSRRSGEGPDAAAAMNELSTPFGELTGAGGEAAAGSAAMGGTGSGADKVHESALQGKLLQGELEREQLKAQRLQAVREKHELQKQFDALLTEKQEAERRLLEAEAERLKAAKALMDLDLEVTVNKGAKEGREVELEGALVKAEGEKKALSEEAEELTERVSDLERELRTSQNEKEDLLRELLAARNSLEKQRQQGQSLLSDARERDLEIVRSVKQAEQRGEQIDAQGRALATAREETEQVRRERHEAETRVTALEAEVAALRREAATAKAQREELLMAKRKAEVQKDLFEVYMKKERGSLELERQRLKDTLLEGQREAREAAKREADVERVQGQQRAKQLVEARAELADLKQRYAELEDRNSELEEAVDDGERRLQKANESFRETLAEAVAVQFGNAAAAQQDGEEQTTTTTTAAAGGGGSMSARLRAATSFATGAQDGMGGAQAAAEASSAALLESMRSAYEAHEAHLRTRLEKLQRRLWNALEIQRQQAAAEMRDGKRRPGLNISAEAANAAAELSSHGSPSDVPTNGTNTGGRVTPSNAPRNGVGGAAITPGPPPTDLLSPRPPNMSVHAHGEVKSHAEQMADRRAARDAIALAGEEAARSALQAEGRAVLQAYVEEAAQLRMERGTLRGQLEAAAVQAKFAASMYAEEHERLTRELEETKVRTEAALQTLHETGGENASVKLQREGVSSRHAQQDLLSQLDAIKEHRDQLVRLKEQEREETGSSFEEVRIMRAELMALRNEISERLTKDPRKVANLRLQIKNFHITCAELERERSNWMRRATAAEMQLETLQVALGDNLAKYQASMLKLRKQMQADGKKARGAGDDDETSLPPPTPPPGGGAGGGEGGGGGAAPEAAVIELTSDAAPGEPAAAAPASTDPAAVPPA